MEFIYNSYYNKENDMTIKVLSDFIGKQIKLIEVFKAGENGIYQDNIHFHFRNGEIYVMSHDQDCCEVVYLADVVGDWEDLYDNDLLIAEEVTKNCHDDPEVICDESATWTFYKFATRKGYVDLKWVGESNGYYSESVDIDKIQNETENLNYL